MRYKRGPLLQLLAGAFGSLAVATSQNAAIAQSAPPDANVREKVTGIGGLFFRAHDPDALAKWYDEHLGVLPVPTSYGGPVWQQEAGPTAFAPFPETTGYFGDASKMWMVNFRVGNLDKMVEQLRASGIAVKVDPQKYPNGRFARLKDPEGNHIELWQPEPSS